MQAAASTRRAPALLLPPSVTAHARTAASKGLSKCQAGGGGAGKASGSRRFPSPPAAAAGVPNAGHLGSPAPINNPSESNGASPVAFNWHQQWYPLASPVAA